MISRDVILGRVRQALAGGGAPVRVPRDYRRDTGPADLDLLIERLVDYKAHVHVAEDVAAAVATIAGTATLVVPPGLPPPLNGWTASRDLPEPPRESFRDWWAGR